MDREKILQTQNNFGIYYQALVNDLCHHMFVKFYNYLFMNVA